MERPDLSNLKEGSIFGISMYGAVRAIGVVERISNGIMRARAINGQYPIAFVIAESGIPAHLRADNWRDAAMLNGDWAKGMEISFVGDIPDDCREILLAADKLMQGRSYGEIKRIYGMIEHVYRHTLEFMNNSLVPERPMQMAM